MRNFLTCAVAVFLAAALPPARAAEAQPIRRPVVELRGELCRWGIAAIPRRSMRGSTSSRSAGNSLM